MKQHGFRACESRQTYAERWQGFGSPSPSDRQYWAVASDSLFVIRPSSGGRFVYEDINPAFEALIGIASEDIREMDLRDCMGSEDATSISEAVDACFARGGEIRIRHRLGFGGSPRNVETIVAPVRDSMTGAIVRVIGSHRFVDERSSDNLDWIWDKSANMSVALLSVQEDIQQRIAADLHDSTCQHLIAASLGLMRMRHSLGEPAGAERLCNEIDASIDQALKEIRGYAYLLHPQDLTAAGLKATIEKYAEEFAARTSLKVAARISAEIDRLPCEAQRSLLRVVQEALTNVFRHAKATEVDIVIDATGTQFRLSVTDNGRGMPRGRTHGGAAADLRGVGIPAMRVRLQKIGGSLEIRSGLGTRRPGTTVYAVFPRVPASLQAPSPGGRHRRQDSSKRAMNKRVGR